MKRYMAIYNPSKGYSISCENPYVIIQHIDKVDYKIMRCGVTVLSGNGHIILMSDKPFRCKRHGQMYIDSYDHLVCNQCDYEHLHAK